MSTGVDFILGRVMAVHRGQCDVEVPDQEGWVLCSVRGHLREICEDASRKEINPVTVGDLVDITQTGPQQGVVETIRPRLSELARPHVHSSHLKQVFCANIDQVAIMVSLREPRFKPQIVDRLVVIALWGNVQPILVLTKADLAKPGEIKKVRDMVAGFDIPVIELATLEGRGIEEVRNLCQGKLTAFCGQSGVGKSTLLNALAGREIVPTQEVNKKTGKGRHTTSWAEIYRFPGAEVIDLPGNRQFGLWQLPPEAVTSFLPDIFALGQECRFHPCSHTHEPACRVRQAAEEGTLAPERYRNYVRIYESLSSK